MKKLFFGFIFAALFLGVVGTASADHRHYSGCGHKGYGYHRSYAPGYGYNRHYNGRYNSRHYYGRHHYSYAPVYVAPAPVYVAPVYPNYWHDHYYRGGYNRCHYYGGSHHYGGYYRPQNRFHFGISIFR
jgi:hypothetical protein